MSTNNFIDIGRNYGVFDIVKDYRWTLSDKIDKNTPDTLDEVPYVQLTEYEVDESTIETQLSYYAQGAFNTASDIFEGTTDVLKPYEQLFPRKKTNVSYRFPYFSDVNFQITTPVWQSLDTLKQGSDLASGIAGFFGGQKAAEFTKGIIEGGAALAGAGLMFSYPKVGITDRPRLWDSHEFRSIEIKFPLFNTISPTDWQKNRDLCWTLINSNLFLKRSFITAVPPVFYEVVIPGQHYSYASCVTNLTVLNRGNMRKFLDKNGIDAIVPDAYEINLTLTDMVMPSRNLFQTAFNRRVISSGTARQ